MNPILEVLRTQEAPVSNDKLDAFVAAKMGLSKAVMLVVHKEGADTPEAYYRMVWARSYLKKIGLIENPKRAMWGISPTGREAGLVDPKDVVAKVQAGANAESLAVDIPEHLAEELLELYLKIIAERKPPTGDVLAACYETFRHKFGPEVLQGLDGEALLLAVHGRGTKDSLVYWLEFKNDDEMPRVFGSIAGGNALKFGLYQNADTGYWMTGSANNQIRLSLAEAIELVRKQRAQFIAGAQVLASVGTDSAKVNYQELHDALLKAAPDVAETAWGHKYFALLYPSLLDDYHAIDYQKYHLLRLHKLPNERRYENARYFVGVARQLDMPVNHLGTILNHRHGSPRSYWRIQVDSKEWPQFREGGYVALGWSQTGSLADLQPGKLGRAHVKNLIEAKYPNESNAATQLYRFASEAGERDLVVVSCEKEVVAVGQFDGPYLFDGAEAKAHRLPVRWISVEKWKLPKREAPSKNFVPLRAVPNILEIERRVELPEPPQPNESPIGETSNTPRSTLSALHGTLGRIEAVLKRKKQAILYGPPGTGKTYWAEKAMLELAARSWFGRAYETLSDSEREQLGEEAIERCCFHPAYGYEDFVIGYRPILKNEQLVFEPEKGVFARMCDRAIANPERGHFVLIDEINRGDIPRIFGELLMVLENDKRGMAVALPISGQKLVVPANLYLIGTMNTADRSIALLDAALRRRFGFIELMPDSKVLGTAAIEGLPLGPWLDELNRRVMEFVGRDARSLQVGHSYLLVNGEPVQDVARFAHILRDDVIPLLQEYCYEDFEALAQILGKDLVPKGKRQINESLFDPERRLDLMEALLAASEGIATTTKAIDAATPEEVDDDDADEEDTEL